MAIAIDTVTREEKTELSETQIEELVKSIQSLRKSQKDNGFGNPKAHVDELISKYAISRLVSRFPEKNPDPFKFPRFACAQYYLDDATTETQLKTFPRYAMVALADSVSRITVSVDGEHRAASIPLLPSSVQAMMNQVKEMVPSVKFHIVFAPKWTPIPDPDPVVLAEADGRFFQIAQWDNADNISDLLT
jgi:hypothetical protein